MKKHSILYRIIMTQAITLGLAVLLYCGLLMNIKFKEESGLLDTKLRVIAQAFAEVAAATINQPTGMAERMASFESTVINGLNDIDEIEDTTFPYEVSDRSGNVVYRSSGLNLPINSSVISGFSDITINSESYRAVKVGSADGEVMITMLDSNKSRRITLFYVVAESALVVLAVFFAGLVGLWLAAKRSFKPLTNLSEQMLSRPAGDLAPFDIPTRDIETSTLVNGLNQLMRRESDRREIERGFIADAAHELRTPLAVLGAQAHVLRDAKTEFDKSAALSELNAGLRRASHTINQLLLIARLESFSVLSSAESFNASELAAQRIASFAPMAKRKRIELNFEAPDNQVVFANAEALGTVFDNLIHNAILYSPEGARVVVSIAPSDLGVECAVMDTGYGIADRYRSKVLERFFRVPGNANTGSGLGLSIVQTILNNLRSELILLNRPDGSGLIARFTLPNQVI